VRSGELPWTNFDRLHRMSLDQVLADMGIDGLDSAARDEFTLAWERLPAWPDASAGLATLTDRFNVATLSDGYLSQQEVMLPFTGPRRTPTVRRATSPTLLLNLMRRTPNFLDEASPPPGDALPSQAALRWVQISPPEFEGPLEVALGGVMIVNGQVGHRETVC